MDYNQILDLVKNNVVEVTFTKINGDERVMTCTLVESYLPPVTKTEDSSQKKAKTPNTEALSVWDVNANGWRSFRLDRVTKLVVPETE